MSQPVPVSPYACPQCGGALEKIAGSTNVWKCPGACSVLLHGSVLDRYKGLTIDTDYWRDQALSYINALADMEERCKNLETMNANQTNTTRQAMDAVDEANVRVNALTCELHVALAECVRRAEINERNLERARAIQSRARELQQELHTLRVAYVQLYGNSIRKCNPSMGQVVEAMFQGLRD